MGSQALHLQLELASFQKIVTVEVLDEFSPGHRAAGFTRSPHATVLLVDHPDLGVVTGQGVGDNGRLIRGPVVDNNDLYRSVCLLQHAHDGFGEHSRPVENG